MRVGLIIATFCATTLLGGCSAAPLPVGATVPAAKAYTLAAGDKLRITTFGFKDLSGEFAVAADNSISLPLVGAIGVHNLTPTELEAKIAGILREKDLVRDPRVSAEVIEYRPYFILGEVGKPGQYPFTNGLTALKAVAAAQGFTYRANERVVFITPDNSRTETRVVLTASTPISPGDTIRVGQRYF